MTIKEWMDQVYAPKLNEWKSSRGLLNAPAIVGDDYQANADFYARTNDPQNIADEVAYATRLREASPFAEAEFSQYWKDNPAFVGGGGGLNPLPWKGMGGKNDFFAKPWTGRTLSGLKQLATGDIDGSDLTNPGSAFWNPAGQIADPGNFLDKESVKNWQSGTPEERDLVSAIIAGGVYGMSGAAGLAGGGAGVGGATIEGGATGAGAMGVGGPAGGTAGVGSGVGAGAGGGAVLGEVGTSMAGGATAGGGLTTTEMLLASSALSSGLSAVTGGGAPSSGEVEVPAGAIDPASGPTAEDMTPLDKEVARISAEQWNRYITTFRPFEDAAMADVRDADRYKTVVQGAINANLMQEQGSLSDWAYTTKGQFGSLASPRGSGTAGTARGLSRGAVAGVNALDSERTTMMGNVVELGRGGGDLAVSGLGTAAKMATQEAISDWGYQQGMKALDTRSALNDAYFSTAQDVQTMNYLSSLFASGGAVVGYGIEKEGWFRR